MLLLDREVLIVVVRIGSPAIKAGFFRYSGSMIDDPEFVKYVISQMPVDALNNLHDLYKEQKTGDTSFNLWFSRLPQNAYIMNLIHQLYLLDLTARQRGEVYKVTLKTEIIKQNPKRRTDPITNDEIVEFYKSLSPKKVKSIDGLSA